MGKKLCVVTVKNNLVEWLNLPLELWLVIISKNPNSAINVIRFRSVCSLWRSILPPPPPCPTLHVPHQNLHVFIQSKIYRLEPSSNSCSNKGWIIKVEESKSGKLRHLDVLTNTHIPPAFPSKVFNFTNLRVMELFESYTLNFSKDGGNLYPFEPVDDVCKVVLFPIEDHGHMVVALHKDRTLRVSNIEDKNWMILNNGNNVYEDIIHHKGKLYVVDKSGTIFWINCSSFKLVQFLSNLDNFGTKKQLVESHGILYMVDMYIKRTRMNTRTEILNIIVFKLDEESRQWLRVSDLGDVLFVLGKDSNFSLSAKDYYGFQRNCIYFSSNNKVACFSLMDSRFKYVGNIFRPSSILFNYNNA